METWTKKRYWVALEELGVAFDKKANNTVLDVLLCTALEAHNCKTWDEYKARSGADSETPHAENSDTTGPAENEQAKGEVVEDPIEKAKKHVASCPALTEWIKGQCKGRAPFDAVDDSCKECEKDYPEDNVVCRSGVRNFAAGGETKTVTSGATKRRGPRGGVNTFGHALNSQAAQIDAMLLEGIHTTEQIAVACETKVSRVRSHLYHLKQRGHVVVNVKGIVRMIVEDQTQRTATAA